jgi:hypothetical protein
MIRCDWQRWEKSPQKIRARQRKWPTLLRQRARQEGHARPHVTRASLGEAAALQHVCPRQIVLQQHRDQRQQIQRQKKQHWDRRQHRDQHQERENHHRYPCHEREKQRNHHLM